MKKFWIITGSSIASVILLVGIAFMILTGIGRHNYVKGTVEANINGAPADEIDIDCNYEGTDSFELIYVYEKQTPLSFANRGSRYGMYNYQVEVCNDQIKVTPTISLFKTNWHSSKKLKIFIDVYKMGNQWDADVYVEVNGNLYQQTFYNVEYNDIEIRVE